MLSISLDYNHCVGKAVVIITGQEHVLVSILDEEDCPLQIEFTVQSELGVCQKHVLKNAESVERFINDELRQMIYRVLVYPNMFRCQLAKGNTA